MSVIQDIKARMFRQEEVVVAPVVPVSKVVMYTTRFCPYCMRARSLLQGKHVTFKDIAVDGKPELRQEMVQKSGHFTVPQIWIGGQHIGGCDELMALDRGGDLDRLLAMEGNDE